ncbi:response regulator receiver protein [Pseudopedobacter saltans DSM 12145]|uniref:Response regulator receiver protein n=1 Tax=Pseudopedobacter saltans (strain ATCC 51119 / DSM 12145 / JCM 21818 / CCUG 39354 / LMG 10337 / NBRC 100064 / NCIMB 13643) TaxID=762903 RepID=F0SBV4_PSESL|nr:response regulator [Pseudopedobacter saltans]ADY53795.1 response regulator receiver protein [Pseudopedobacter saltans DSM 12145]
MEKSSIHLFVVDDDEINILISRKVLSKYFSNIEFEMDGNNALEKILSKKFDLVLLDVNMPDISGFDIVRTVRAQPEEYFKQLPIIANTASILPDDIQNILKVGFTTYQSKPLRVDVLLREIDKLTLGVHS